MANDCSFTNKDEIVKFLYLTHNQNTRVREHSLKELTDTTSLADMLRIARVCEHSLKELTDTTSLADMLRIARVCEGTVHFEEISKQ